MDLMSGVKLALGVTAAVFGVASCVLWWISADVEVLEPDVPKDQDGEFFVNHKGRQVAVVASARKQSRISGRAAICASIAALAQVVLVVIPAFEP
jgi:hypothetical protein